MVVSSTILLVIPTPLVYVNIATILIADAGWSCARNVVNAFVERVVPTRRVIPVSRIFAQDVPLFLFVLFAKGKLAMDAGEVENTVIVNVVGTAFANVAARFIFATLV